MVTVSNNITGMNRKIKIKKIPNHPYPDFFRCIGTENGITGDGITEEEAITKYEANVLIEDNNDI